VRVYLESLGCKLNQCERDALAAQFAQAGHVVVLDPAQADVCVLNTCAVTHVAARKSRQRMRYLQRSNPAARLVATGCYVTLGENGLAADLCVGNEDKDDLVAQVEALLEQWHMVPTSADASQAEALKPRTRPMVKIQDGCDNECTYCIVHVLRGKQRSRARDAIMAEVAGLIRQGYQEVVLTGVHIGSYGRDRGESLERLVRAILSETPPKRLRLSSLEPWDIDRTFLALWEDPRLCRHLHLSLQSGCDRTLARMNRNYTAAQYAALVAEAREAIPDLAVTTDVIAGFPGETEADFGESAALVERTGFARTHVFVYSPRPGTPAADMPDQVDPQVRKARAARLRAIGGASSQQFRLRFVGRTMPVLWETRRPDGRWSGLTDNYMRVYVDSELDLANTIREVHLLGLKRGGLCGTLA
jgi:threonylcarbamoyladenosine tRNA methylthiotransferase MtaB